MKAIEFIKKFGWAKAIYVINTDFLTNGEQSQLSGVIVSELKKYTNAYELVQNRGGLDEAKDHTMVLALIEEYEQLKQLQKAITLVEEVGEF